MRRFAPVVVTMLVLASAETARAAQTRNVPADYPTIGAALTAAGAGDTILIADGTYSGTGNTDLTVQKALTIASAHGATTIDLGNQHRFLNANAAISLRGLRIIHSGNLGAVFLYAPATLVDSTFDSNNDTEEFGIVHTDSNLAVDHCSFTNNTGLGALNGGTLGTTITIANSSFDHNSGYGGSGAIYVNSSNVTITGCSFTHNAAGVNGYGGAITHLNGTLSVTDSVFTDNGAGYAAGAIALGAEGVDTPATITRTVFSDNHASQGGVFVFVSSEGVAPLTVTDSIFLRNTATADGAVVDATATNTASAISFINTSFWGNHAGGAGGGAFAGGSHATLTVTNSMLYDAIGAREVSTANPFASTKVKSSNVAESRFAGSNANISVDPGYADADAGDLRIVGSSACAGAGVDAGVPATDFFQQRWGSAVSIGAYAPHATHFDVAAPPVADGGVPFEVTVTPRDFADAAVPTFDGVVHVTSSDPGAILPADGPLGDGGVLAVTLVGPGSETITITELSDGGISGTSGPIQLGAAAADAAVVEPTGVIDAGGTANAAPPTTADDGCGCEAAGASRGGGALVAPLFGVLVWLGRRRRRRGSRP